MPSISQAELNRLKEGLAESREASDGWERDARFAEARVRTFNVILDKIIKTAQGLGNSGQYPINTGYSFNSGYPPMVPEDPRSTEQRLHDDLSAARDQRQYSDSRLAAVIAVAEFAKEHKT